jgi:hypothetical protein
MAYKGPQVVVGPSSSTDDTVPRFDLTSGALIQGSSVTIDDSDVMGGITQLNVDNIRIDGNTISSTDTNGDVVLAPDGDGTVSITGAPIVPSTDRADSLGSATNSWDNVYADGLTFDDGSNVLSHYSTGTWTPVLTFGGGSTGLTYNTNINKYTRVGNMVQVNCALVITAKGTSTGNISISGLPFTSASSPANLSISSVRSSGFSSVPAGTNELFWKIPASGTALDLQNNVWAVGTGNMTDTYVTVGTVLVVNGIYYV